MDQSYSDSDISLSPSQILERLQVLRQLQLMQQGKLHKQRVEYQDTTENSSGITEIVSQFSNSTTYNTFRSLLETTDDVTPRSKIESVTHKVNEKDLIEGVSILNLSQESEFIVKSPSSTKSIVSATSQTEPQTTIDVSNAKSTKKQISLDEIPVLTPKKDFETLILEKLKGEINKNITGATKQKLSKGQTKKIFLKKGEGTSRFGIKKGDLVIQNTKSLPWRKNKKENLTKPNNSRKNTSENKTNNEESITNTAITLQRPKVVENCKSKEVPKDKLMTPSEELKFQHPIKEMPQSLPKSKNPVHKFKGKTWASVLSKEQNDFLHQLKQSHYYKNFASPAKSSVSDASCDENLLRFKVEKEAAEQNMFELLENKVSHESFNLENSFFNRFLRYNQLECSGESTPLVMQQCLAENPNLVKILPKLQHEKRISYSHTDFETNSDECMNCCSETCSTVSSCCSCKTLEENNSTLQNISADKDNNLHQEKEQYIEKKGFIKKSIVKKSVKALENEKKQSDNVYNNDNEIKANIVEMNEKLIATSELLKERLCELENEIETFRQENANLTKVREEFDAERQKFYEEKAMFEQKSNEDKILSEYYLAEEKEKLSKQKQMYDKYVREIRGRLNKKDKDEVISLKKDINDLKEEIRLKDSKSTSTIARLRNQIKILEKEKKDLLDETEKLKKENRRIQHCNDITRRVTNIKYLEEINKKLSNITAKETQSEINFDNNTKYKSLEIERQGRLKKVQVPGPNRPLRARAKSVPNLKVTSRYAKYFSQRDVVSDLDKNKLIDNMEYTCSPDKYQSDEEILHIEDVSQQSSNSDHEENNLEKMYMERFHSLSPKSSKSNLSISNSNINENNLRKSNSPHNHNDFFISKSKLHNDHRLSNNSLPTDETTHLNTHKSRKSTSTTDQRSRNSMQELNVNKHNTIDQISNTSNDSSKSCTPKSPISIITNRSASSHKPTTVIHKDYFRDTFDVSPEPTSSRASVSKTNLNPTEIKKPDGSKELRFPNGNVKFVSSDGKYSRFIYYNGDVKENFYNEGRIKYFYAESKTYHTTHPDGLEVLQFPDGQVEKRYKDGSSEIHLPNGSIRYFDPKNEHVREEWRFPDGTAITVSASGEQRIVFANGQVEVHATDHKRREFPDGTVKLVYNDGTSETRYASGRVRIKDKQGNLIMDSLSR